MVRSKAYLLKSYLPSRVRKRGGKIKRRVQGFFLKGNNVECPVCGKIFNRFLSGGTMKRKNAVCPNCDSFERHRLLWLYIENKTDLLKKEHTLLHFAPEDALKRNFSRMKNIRYITTDLGELSVTLNSDIQNLPFKEKSFDALICSHVLEHIPDDKKAMEEIFRILKDEGWAILQVPINEELEKTFEDPSITSPSERLKIFGQEDHLRNYGRDYYERLEDAGFKVTKDDFVQTLSPENRKKFALMDNEIICLLTKPS